MLTGNRAELLSGTSAAFNIWSLINYPVNGEVDGPRGNGFRPSRARQRLLIAGG